MTSFKIIGLWVLEKKILKVFTIYGHGSNLGHVTKTIFINLYPLFQEGSILKLACIGQVVLEKKFENNGHIHVHSPVSGSDIKT